MRFLHVALQSHREALRLQQDNEDALFNMAQVLTSLAEAITESKHLSEEQKFEALRHLREALELFQRCLVLQEFRYTESQEQTGMLEGDAGSRVEESETMSSQSLPKEEWAAVVEPVTKGTLVDTAVAQLEALTTLCGLLTIDPGSGLAWVEEYSSDLLRTKIAAYAEGTDRQHEVSLARAKFWSALTEVSYRTGRIDIETYKREISGAFGPNLDLANDPEGLCSKAEALMSFNSAAGDVASSRGSGEFNGTSVLRWQALSSAQDALSTASKLAAAENVSKIHLARGDVEMCRWRLGHPPWNHVVSQESSSTLLQNAQTYYRGAAVIARRNGAAEEERDGSCKEALAAALGGDWGKLKRMRSVAGNDVLVVAEDMVEEGLVSSFDIETLLS